MKSLNNYYTPQSARCKREAKCEYLRACIVTDYSFGTCLRCRQALDLKPLGPPLECCGLMYSYTKDGNVSIFDVWERTNPLYEFAVPLSVSAGLAIAITLAYALGNPPQISHFAFSFVLVIFEIWVVFLFVKGAFDWHKKKVPMPTRNNNFSKALLLSVVISAAILSAIISGSLSTEECIETRYYSTC